MNWLSLAKQIRYQYYQENKNRAVLFQFSSTFNLYLFSFFYFAKFVIYSKTYLFCASLYTTNMHYVCILWDLRTEILHIFSYMVANDECNVNASTCIIKQWLISFHWITFNPHISVQLWMTVFCIITIHFAQGPTAS